MGILRTNTLSGIGTDGPVFDGVTRFDTQGYFVPPPGTTDQRSAGITTTQGAIRFNTDSQKLEFYAQDQWFEMVIDTPDLGVGSNTGAGARGVFMGGSNEPSPNTTYNTLDYVTISTTGNAIDFGDLSAGKQEANSFSSATRGFYFGGDPALTAIETFVFSSTGNATSFGNLTGGSKTGIGVANSTRGIAALCTNPATNVINYITMASTGSGIDFGDNTTNASANGAGCQSSTRGIFAGGSPGVNTIGFITISTLGDTADFGDLSQARFGMSGTSNATRGLFSGGYVAPTGVNTIDYITIATLGNAADFGDLNTAGVHYTAGCSSSTRSIRGGGADNAAPAGNYSNAIDYVQIMSTGNAVDFGDLTRPVRHLDACSNAHGGL
jgi:hypothetical protein